MGEVFAHIQLTPKAEQLGWTYSHWSIDFGKGEPTQDEEVRVKCAVTDPQFMTETDAIEEAKARILLKVEQECGRLPEEDITWQISTSS